MAVFLAGCDPVDADFFPLNEGNTWLYDWTRADHKQHEGFADSANSAGAATNTTWTLQDTPGLLAEREARTLWHKSGSTAIALTEGSPASSIEYRGEYRPGGTLAVRKLNGILEIVTASNLQESALQQLSVKILVYPVHAGARWEEAAPGTGGQIAYAMCRLIGFETVETSAGTFYQCAHVVRVIDPSISNALASFTRIQHYWLAPDIGLVKILYESETGPVMRAELRAFQLQPIPPALAERQRRELDETMDPAGMAVTGRPAGEEEISPEEMHRRYLYTTHEDFRR